MRIYAESDHLAGSSSTVVASLALYLMDTWTAISSERLNGTRGIPKFDRMTTCTLPTSLSKPALRASVPSVESHLPQERAPPCAASSPASPSRTPPVATTRRTAKDGSSFRRACWSLPSRESRPAAGASDNASPLRGTVILATSCRGLRCGSGCTQYCLRRKVLKGDMSRYSCFQGYFTFCCCIKGGACCEDNCPNLCAFLEGCLCSKLSISTL